MKSKDLEIQNFKEWIVCNKNKNLKFKVLKMFAALNIYMYAQGD